MANYQLPRSWMMQSAFVLLIVHSVCSKAIAVHTIHRVDDPSELLIRDDFSANQSATIRCEAAFDCVTNGFGDDAICEQGLCVKNTSISPANRDVWASLAAFFSVVLAAGSGLGGGGLLVPVYILVLGISSHEAIPLSKATIFGSAIASLIVNLRQRHPFVANRPLIDYETILMMEPMTLAGTIVGVNLNAVCPEWLITVLIVWLLTQTSRRTFAKGRLIWNEENAADKKILREIVAFWKLLPYQHNVEHFVSVAHAYLKWRRYRNQARPSLSAPGDVKEDWEQNQSLLEWNATAPVIISIQEHQHRQHRHENEQDEEEEIEDESRGFLSSESTVPKERAVIFLKKTLKLDGIPVTLDEIHATRRQVPVADMVVLSITWVALIVFSLVKGGHGTPSIAGVRCGSLAYWTWLSLSLPFFTIVTMLFGYKISQQHTVMDSCGYEYAKGDVRWTRKAVVKYPLLCTLAGIAAGLLGIGGGMVKGPLLLEMGLLPQVAAATSSSMILFTSSATTIQFIVLGMLPMDQALWHGLVGFCGGLVGQVGLSWIVRKYRKTSFVIFLIGAIVGSSGVIMGLLGLDKFTREGFQGFRSLCG